MSTIAKAKAARGQDIGSDDDGGTPPCGVERNGVIVDRRADGQSVIVLTQDVIATGGADVNIGRDCKR